MELQDANMISATLTRIITDRLLREFRKHGKCPDRSYWENGHLVDAWYDPWWWPIDPANRPEYWGLRRKDDTEFQSLCEVPRRGKLFPGFAGSLGARPGCIVVVGERPSFNTRYGSAVTKLYDRLKTLAALADLQKFLGKEPSIQTSVTDLIKSVHVTDLIKFRGMSFDDNLTTEMVTVSADCIHKELEHLKPKLILTTDMAAKRLEDVRSIIKRDPLKTVSNPLTIEVPHWSRNSSACSWSDIVKSSLLNGSKS